jgi:excisionase family DNA binding protein
MNTHDVNQKLTEIQHQLQDRVFQQKEILNLQEAASFLCIAKSTMYKLTHRGQIKFHKPSGKIILFRRDDLISWVERNNPSETNQLNSKNVSNGSKN